MSHASDELLEPELILRESAQAELSGEELRHLQRVLSHLYTAIRCEPGTESTVVITDDDEIRELNAQWRGLDAPTDVLSFAYQEAEDATMTPDLLGDVIISVPTARRYAESGAHAEWLRATSLSITHWTFLHELAFLVIHGFLHLLGYDHENEDDEAEMREAELKVFGRIERALKEDGPSSSV